MIRRVNITPHYDNNNVMRRLGRRSIQTRIYLHSTNNSVRNFRFNLYWRKRSSKRWRRGGRLWWFYEERVGEMVFWKGGLKSPRNYDVILKWKGCNFTSLSYLLIFTALLYFLHNTIYDYLFDLSITCRTPIGLVNLLHCKFIIPINTSYGCISRSTIKYTLNWLKFTQIADE